MILKNIVALLKDATKDIIFYGTLQSATTWNIRIFSNAL
jgi:hypothetical protein